MVAAAVLAGIMSRNGHQLVRREGILLLAFFLAFTVSAY